MFITNALRIKAPAVPYSTAPKNAIPTSNKLFLLELDDFALKFAKNTLAAQKDTLRACHRHPITPSALPRQPHDINRASG